MTGTIGCFIDGRRTGGAGRRTAPVFNPATGEETAHAVLSSAEDGTLP